MTTTTATERPRLTVLRAAWLFDGTSATLRRNPALILDGGKITAISTPNEVPAEASIVDMEGATLVPGLVDPHVHLAFDATGDVVANLAARDDVAAFAAMLAWARHAARGGVTTVRDLGDRGYLSIGVREAARTDTSLPTVVAAGPPITTPGGHCHYLGGATPGTVSGVRAAVCEHAERGVDVIKIMASGGHLTPGTKPELGQFGPAELRAAVREAHRHNLPITAHAHGTRAVLDALASGMDGLEHVSFMSEDSVDPVPEEVLATIGGHQVTLGLTLGMMPNAGGTPPPGLLAKIPLVMANLERLYRAGASIVAGSDAGVGPPKPPDVLRWAIGDLVRLGMTPAEALHANTAKAAALCGLGDRKGRLAAGFDADILAVDGNPLVDPAALHQIRAVYLRGQRLVSASAVTT